MKSNSGQASTLEPHDSSPFSTLQLMRVTASEATSLLSACSFKDLVGTKKSVAKIHHTHFFRPSPPTHPPTHPPTILLSARATLRSASSAGASLLMLFGKRSGERPGPPHQYSLGGDRLPMEKGVPRPVAKGRWRDRRAERFAGRRPRV